MIAEALIDRLVANASAAELRRLALHLLGDEGEQVEVLRELADQVAALAKRAAPVVVAPALPAPANDDDDADVDAVLAAIGLERAR